MLTCPQCGAPVQIGVQGGQAQCGYCHAPLTISARDDSASQPLGPGLSEAERYQGLWAQAQSFGAKILPPEMLQVLHGGALTPDRAGPALTIWRMYCSQAHAGDLHAGELAILMTGSLSSYFSVVAKDPARQRALYESTLDQMRAPHQKQVVRGLLSRAALKAGDLASAKTWFAACDAHSADLQADTAYRLTYACLATAHNDFRNVLAALGPNPQAVPVALPSRLMIDVYRANAHEKLGDMNSAVSQLVQSATTIGGGRTAIPDIVEVNGHMHLCPQSLGYARQQWGHG